MRSDLPTVGDWLAAAFTVALIVLMLLAALAVGR